MTTCTVIKSTQVLVTVLTKQLHCLSDKMTQPLLFKIQCTCFLKCIEIFNVY